jgi:hypothetical protein
MMVMNPEVLEELRNEYILAKKENKETFMFKGHHLDINYAKYLIEYCDTAFKINENEPRS